jgi:hypothetical protein
MTLAMAPASCRLISAVAGYCPYLVCYPFIDNREKCLEAFCWEGTG